MLYCFCMVMLTSTRIIATSYEKMVISPMKISVYMSADDSTGQFPSCRFTHKCSFFQAVMSILLYGCTTWTLTKCMKKKLDGNYSRAVLNKSWRQLPMKQQLYGHLPLITKTIQVKQTRHVGHCWRSKDELISGILLLTLSHGQAKVGWPARTALYQYRKLSGRPPRSDGW